MKTIDFKFDDLERLKTRLYRFANQFDVCHAYDSNLKASACEEDTYEFLLGLDLKKNYSGTLENQLKEAELSNFWKFLAIPYGRINEINHALVFEPKMVFSIAKNDNTLIIQNNGIDETEFQDLLNLFSAFHEVESLVQLNKKTQFVATTGKSEYIKQIEQIRDDIYNGVYYEINYCIEFKADFESDNLLPYYFHLNELTQAPFAAYIKHPHLSMLCSSPERFVKREGSRLLSQPIKGTNKRLSAYENEIQLQLLRTSVKERAENVMIVDLVRNDMAKVSKPGSVKVLELCGAYAYKSVNHLVSSIESELKDHTNGLEIFDALFPMGSMTGAPKVEVMKHIQDYEHNSRGFYSGCIGFIDPNGDFDFNVCIRTLIYSPALKEISYKVGSAITYDSNPEQEYEECLIKGSRMLSVFEKD